MIMIGILCEGCSGHLLDSGTRCHRCGHPYSEFALQVVRHHQAAADAIVARVRGRNLTEEEIDADVRALSAATTAIGCGRHRFGAHVPAEYIERHFEALKRF